MLGIKHLCLFFYQKYLRIMRRSKELLESRRNYVKEYVNINQHKQMKVIVCELTERLFVSERTIYNILKS